MAIQLARFNRAVRSARVGQVRSPRPSDQSDLRALAGIGATTVNIGLGLIAQEKRRARELEVVDANREIAIGNGFVNQQLVEHKAFASQTTDVEKIREDWTKRDKTIQDFNSKAINPKAKQRLSNTYNANKAIWQGTSDARVNVIVEDRANASLIRRAENVAVGDNSVEVATENELRSISTRAGEPAELLDEEQFKLGKINELISSGTWDDERKLAIVNRISGLAMRAEDARISNALLGLGTAQRDGDGVIDEAAGIEAINSTDASATQKQSAISKLSTQSADEKQARGVALEANREKDRDGINKLKLANDLVGLQTAVENSSLDETEQGRELQWIANETRRIAKGAEIVVNVQALEDAKNIADSIALQRATFKETADLASELRYGESPLIDDAGFSAIMSIARTSLKAGEAASRSAAYSTGVRQIVGIELPPAGSMEEVARQIALLKGTVQTPGEKLRWQLQGEYMNEMRKWFTDNPDKIKESYQVMASKAQLYKGIAELSEPTIETLREVSQRTGKSFGELAEDKVSPKTFKKGDKRTVQGREFTFDGKVWRE